MGVLAVVYDDGAARPADIAVGLAEKFPCVFVLGPTEHAQAMKPLLAEVGAVVDGACGPELAAKLRVHSPAGIVTFSERAIRLTSELAEDLGLPYQSRQAAELLTDKVRQRSVLRDAGLDSVRFRAIDAEADWPDAVAEVGLPAVLKPVHGASSRNTFLVDRSDAGLARVRDLLAQESPGLVPGGGLVLEEYLHGRPCRPFGDYVSVENYACDGVVHDIAVTGKLPLAPPFRETGWFWPSPLDPTLDGEVRRLARAAVAALGVLVGVTHTEVKLTPTGPRLIEVNGRIGGGINDLALSTSGTNLIEFACRLALGERPGPPPAGVGRAQIQILHPAPRRPCRLVAVDGAEEVRALPGVSLYRPYVRPGAELAGGVQTQLLCVVRAEAPGLPELAALVQDVNSRLHYHFAFPGREPVSVVPAADLGAL